MTKYTPAQEKAAELFHAAESGNVQAQVRFAESIAHTDLPTQLRPVINGILLKELDEVETTFEKYTTKDTVQTIGEEESVKVYGWNDDNVPGLNHGDKFVPGTLPRVGNRQQYPQIALQATDKKKIAHQYGLALDVDWQTIVNSRGARIDLIRDGVQELARSAKRHEDYLPATNIVTGSGFNTAKLGTTGHALSGNPTPFTITAIQAAVKAAQAFKIDKRLIHFPKFALLVAPGNKTVVNQALSGSIIRKVEGETGTAGQGDRALVSYEQRIDLGINLEVVEVPWLTEIWSGFGDGFVMVPQGGPRPAITRNYLQGYETPQLFIKSSNAVNFSGGTVPYMDGDFDSDAIAAKVRHVYGSDVHWNQGIVYSNGTGS